MTTIVRNFIQRLISFTEAHRLLIGYGLIVLSSSLWISRLAGGWMKTGGEPFQTIANDFVIGKMPYRDRVLEYPPYSIPIFVLPRLLFGKSNYLGGFMILAFLVDCGVKVLLLHFGLCNSNSRRALLPVLLYSIAMLFLREFFLLRYDVWVAFACLVAIWLACKGQQLLCGFTLAIGIGIKLYPIVFVSPLLLLARKQEKLLSFVAGLCCGLLPIALLGFVLPWWRFAEFQGSRGLQAESIYASILWTGEQLNLAHVTWSWNEAWFEVQGSVALAVVPFARGVFICAVIGATLFSNMIIMRWDTVTLGRLSRLLLVPLLSFVIFNLVLSPQFMIWLVSVGAIATLEGSVWLPLLIPLAALLTPVFYPSPEYDTGLNGLETVTLLYRNFLLVATLGGLVFEFGWGLRKPGTIVKAVLGWLRPLIISGKADTQCKD